MNFFKEKLITLGKTALFSCVLVSSRSIAEWDAKLDTSAYYTDDVGLFSVTRRLSLKEDPTQPVVDSPNQGSDFIYEPSAEVTWSGENGLGEMELSLDAGGYVFIDQSSFTHGFYEIKASQHLGPETKVSFYYNLVPDLFLGNNELVAEKMHGVELEERLTSHIWAVHIDQDLSETIQARWLTRFGFRDYDEPFRHRDTIFWTVGPHLEWALTPDIELLLGYHYEQGSSDHRKNITFEDDISYVNHYASAELEIQVMPKLQLLLVIDYEHNDFKSLYTNDLHRGATENLYQGEIELLYDLDEHTAIKLGWEYGERKFSFEEDSVSNQNVWLGIEHHF